MKLEYCAPCLYCDEYVADTMIASCVTGYCDGREGGGSLATDTCYQWGHQYGNVEKGCDAPPSTTDEWNYCWECGA